MSSGGDVLDDAARESEDSLLTHSVWSGLTVAQVRELSERTTRPPGTTGATCGGIVWNLLTNSASLCSKHCLTVKLQERTRHEADGNMYLTLPYGPSGTSELGGTGSTVFQRRCTDTTGVLMPARVLVAGGGGWSAAKHPLPAETRLYSVLSPRLFACVSASLRGRAASPICNITQEDRHRATLNSFS